MLADVSAWVRGTTAGGDDGVRASCGEWTRQLCTIQGADCDKCIVNEGWMAGIPIQKQSKTRMPLVCAVKE